MTDLRIATTLRETIPAIAQAMCVVWEADADTPAVYAEHCRINNADLAHSVIAHTSTGELAGIGVLCLRRERGFILDFGIAPKFRGKGYGHQLCEALVEQMGQAGLHEVTLLVSVKNKAALRIYERAGFRQTREMVSMRGAMAAYAPGSAHEVRNGVTETIMAWYGAGKAARPCWERELSSLLAMKDTRAFEHQRGFLLSRPSPYFNQVDIMHLGLDADAVAEDVNALLYTTSVAYGPELPLALPEEPTGSRAYRRLQGLGFRVVSRSYEMRLEL